MTTIGYEDITDILLNIADPNTGGSIGEVPGVSSPKINAGVSVYNVEADGGIAGWSTDVSWSASDYNTVAWTSGNIYLPDGTSLSVSSGNTGNMSSTTYIYYDSDLGGVYTTTTASSSVGKDKILLCVASPTTSGKKAEFQAFGTDDQSTFVYASNIAANTITGNEIQANSITSSELSVSYLSAISADLGTINAGTITGTTITAGSTSSTAVRLDPNTNRLIFYYGGNQVGYLMGGSLNSGGAILIDASVAGMASGTFVAGGKLKIPVGTNLYG